MNKVKSLTLGLIAILAIGLSFVGCGSSDSTQESIQITDPIDEPIPEPEYTTFENPKVGVFVDNTVAGLYYSCSSSEEGILDTVTDTLGQFTCEDGDSVSFYLGSSFLGTVKVTDIITPLVLFDGNEKAALNFARLIQTLDKDSDLTNGIEITQGIALPLKETIQFTSYSFDKDMQKILGNVKLVTAEDAQQHLDETFASLGINKAGLSDKLTYSWEGEGYCVGTYCDEIVIRTDFACQDSNYNIAYESMCSGNKPPSRIEDGVCSPCQARP